eukprot:6178019-Pleurochrysis_carterae.AAC.1
MSPEKAEVDVQAMDAGTVPTQTDMELFFANIEQLSVLSKWFTKEGKAIMRKNVRIPRTRAPSNTSAKGGFSSPVKLAHGLSELLELEADRDFPRTEVTRLLTAYIKKHELQCPDNKKNFICNESLAKVLGVEEGTQTNWFELQKFLSKLLTSVKKTQDPKTDPVPVLPSRQNGTLGEMTERKEETKTASSKRATEESAVHAAGADAQDGIEAGPTDGALHNKKRIKKV